MWPTPPAPMTTATEPPGRYGTARLTAPYAVSPPSAKAGNLDRDRCAEFHECPGIGRHEVGEPAVEGRAHELEPLAELVMAPSARGAEAARALRVHEHWIPDLHVVDVRANGVNPAGSLMSQDGRKRFG